MKISTPHLSFYGLWNHTQNILIHAKQLISPPHSCPKWIQTDITISSIDLQFNHWVWQETSKSYANDQQKNFLTQCSLFNRIFTTPHWKFYAHWFKLNRSLTWDCIVGEKRDNYHFINYWYATVIRGKTKDTDKLKFWKLRSCTAERNLGNPARNYPSYILFCNGCQVWIQI